MDLSVFRSKYCSHALCKSKKQKCRVLLLKKREKMRKEHETDLSFEEVKKTGLYESVEAFSVYEIITLTSKEINKCMGRVSLYY